MINPIILEKSLSAKDFLTLRKAVNWETPSIPDIESALKHSVHVVSIDLDGTCIACGRIVGDASLVFIVQDIMVHPDHQKKGLGKTIMSALMAYINQHSTKGAFIGLFSASNLENWYSQYGFVARPNSFLGAGMTFIKEFESN